MTQTTNLPLYHQVSEKCSKIITHSYSTSFSLGILALDKRFRAPIRNIYGFVRLADEIVDTFHEYDKQRLLDRFRQDTYNAIDEGISTNPVLHAFQLVVHQYNIERELIDAFLKSMEMDLSYKNYEDQSFDTYVYGSAEVVGLMCLRVFCEGNAEKYESLLPSAKRLGAAFQKINFLRDLKSDYVDRGRVYFPSIEFMDELDLNLKQKIESDIEEDFNEALKGIRRLPDGSRLGVYIAYIYFFALLKKIQKLPPKVIMHTRISISNIYKLYLLLVSYFKFRINKI